MITLLAVFAVCLIYAGGVLLVGELAARRRAYKLRKRLDVIEENLRKG